MYDPKFDLKRPQPGDAELAKAIRAGLAKARESSLRRMYNELSDALKVEVDAFLKLCGRETADRSGVAIKTTSPGHHEVYGLGGVELWGNIVLQK